MSRTSPPYRALSDEELIETSVRDPEAFGVFYDRHARHVFNFFVGALGDREEAADSTADVFTSAVGARQKFNPRKGTAIAWLWAIVHNHKVDTYRSRKRADRLRQKLMIAGRPAVDSFLGEIPSLEGSQLTELLNKLPADQRIAIEEHVIAGSSYEKMAAMHGVSSAALRQRVSRGLYRLRSVDAKNGNSK